MVVVIGIMVVDTSIWVVVGGSVAGTSTGSSSPPPQALKANKKVPPIRNLINFTFIAKA